MGIETDRGRKLTQGARQESSPLGHYLSPSSLKIISSGESTCSRKKLHLIWIIQ
jgi:hypothetical protein